MNCTKCNAPLQPGATFCGSCGQTVSQGAQPQFAPPQGPPPGSPFPQGGGYPPGAYPPPPYGGYDMPVQTRTSGMAIAGFVLSFFCSLLGLIFSIMGYNEAKRSGGTVTGEGLAMAGIIISILSMLLGIIMVAGAK